MPLSMIGSPFQGVTPPGVRRSLKKLYTNLLDQHDRYLVVCCGSFGITEAMVEIGIPPKDITCSDISLFSSVLGYLFDPTKKIKQLGVKVLDEELKELMAIFPAKTETEQAAALLFMMKWPQLSGKSYFLQSQKAEFAHQREAVFKSYCKTLTKLKDKMGGLSYEILDAHAHVFDYMDDSRTCIWYNPPAYKGGYTKMFDPKDMYKWKAPKIEELVMKDVTDFVAKLDDAKATITLYAEEWYPLKCFDTESQWHKWYVEPYGKTKRRIYAFINRDVGSGYMVRPKIHALPKNLPATYDDHEITEKSVLNMVSCDKDLALYYYDMFVRELGMVMAQSYYLFTIDGQVAGTVGFDTRELTMHRKPIIYETFGLSITSERYQRLNRLLMRYITGMEFSNQLMRKWIPPQLFLPHAKYLQTTCLSKYMEVKVNRGLLKLISRKKLPNGRYHLVYKTKLHNEPMKQIVSDWVKKHSEYRRA